jgi:hypothetical protein
MAAGRAELRAKSYYQVGNGAFKLAGYLGYEDIADLRRFLLSRPVLGAMTKASQLGVIIGVKTGCSCLPTANED